MDVQPPAHGSALDTAGTFAVLPEACSAVSPILSASGARASGTTRQPPVIPQGEPGPAPGLSMPGFGPTPSLATCPPRGVPGFGYFRPAGRRRADTVIAFAVWQAGLPPDFPQSGKEDLMSATS